MPDALYGVDAFAAAAFAGNPAAVCLLDAPRDEAWMQDLAREMNLSETAYVIRETQGIRLRWFTPSTEVDLCGHATLAAAHVLWSTGGQAPEATLVFHTRSGELSAVKQGDWIELDFPAEPPSECEVPDLLDAALGTRAVWCGVNRMDLFVEVESEADVRRLRPSMDGLSQLSSPRGIVVTARAESTAYDFVSRFFAPKAGIPEDPVTGSAHCALGPYWSVKLGKEALIGYQASRRGGWVRVRPAGARVRLGGQAVTVWHGRMA